MPSSDWGVSMMYLLCFVPSPQSRLNENVITAAQARVAEEMGAQHVDDTWLLPLAYNQACVHQNGGKGAPQHVYDTWLLRVDY